MGFSHFFLIISFSKFIITQDDCRYYLQSYCIIMNLKESLLLQIKMSLIKKMTFGFKDEKVKIKQK